MLKNNYIMNTVDEAHRRYEKIDYVEGLKVNMTLDILEGCVHSCAGCFVNRRGNSVDNDVLSKLPGIQDLFNNNGIRFSSFIMGPTDIFASNNIEEILKNPHIIKAFGNVSTIEMVTVLDMNIFERMSGIIDLFNKIPKHPLGIMYAMQVVVDTDLFVNDKDYRDNKYEDVKRVLNLFDDDIDFKLVFNMEDKEVDLALISRIARDEWDCLVEPIPSYQRSMNQSTHQEVTKKWRDLINDQMTTETKKDIALTIADFNQGAGKELTYTLTKGKFYAPAFIYDVATIRDEKFEIKDIESIESWTEIKRDLYMDGLKYISKTEECGDCNRRHLCLSKSVLNYMEFYGLTECLLPKKALNNYSDSDIRAKDYNFRAGSSS